MIVDDIHAAEPTLLDLLDHIADLRGVRTDLLMFRTPRAGRSASRVVESTAAPVRPSRPSPTTTQDG